MRHMVRERCPVVFLGVCLVSAGLCYRVVCARVTQVGTRGCCRVSPYDMQLVAGGPSGCLYGACWPGMPGCARVCHMCAMCGALSKVAPCGMGLVCGGPPGCLPGFWGACITGLCARVCHKCVSCGCGLVASYNRWSSQSSVALLGVCLASLCVLWMLRLLLWCPGCA